MNTLHTTPPTSPPAARGARAVALALVALLALTACETDDGPAGANDVEIFWTVAGGDCASAGLLNVRVDLIDRDGVAALTSLFLCGTGNALLREVPAGAYTLKIAGLDDRDVATYEGEDVAIDVAPAADPLRVVPPVELEVRRSEVELVWLFPGGAGCSFNRVREVQVAIWDQSIQAKVHDEVVACEFDIDSQPDRLDGERPAGLLVDGLVPRPVKVEIFALDGDGFRRFRGSSDLVDLLPGTTHRAEVTLAACGDSDTNPCQ